MTILALLDLLDRDGHVRQSLPVTAWPVRVGRAIDNDLVLDDAHIAPHHFTLFADDEGAIHVEAGETLNGLRADGRRVASGGRARVGGAPLRIDAGDSHLRLRLASHALAPERPMKAVENRVRKALSTLAGVLLAAFAIGFSAWLSSDPDSTANVLSQLALKVLIGGLAWCGAWAVLSKVFTRRAHFWWHVRVLVFAVVANYAISAAASLLAYSFSWAWATDYVAIALYAVGAALLYFHLLGIEPRHPERLRAAAVAMFCAAVGLHLWFNERSTDQLGDELYVSSLFPPAWRVARPVDSATFTQGLAPLQARLDKKAKKRGPEDEGDAGGDEDSD